MRKTVAVMSMVGALTVGALPLAGEADAATRKPVVTAVSATTGTSLGGTRVTIRGRYFAHVRSVSFGAGRGRSVRVLSSTRLQVTTPAHAAGVVDVTVRARAGTSTHRRADHFRFVAPPSVTGVSPDAGGAAGGTRVTVTGQRFTAITAVLFGNTPGTDVAVLSSTQLEVTTPVHPSGSYDVRVRNGYGASSASAVDRFRYDPSFSSTPAVALDQTLDVSAYGLRPGTRATIGLDADPTPLATLTVTATGAAMADLVVAGVVADGAHQLHLTGTDGSGAPATFSAPVLIDTVAPDVNDMAVSSGSAQPGDTINFSAHVTDAGGVKFVAMEVDAVSPAGVATPCPRPVAHLASGSATDGIWTATCVIPPTAAAGTYQLVPWGVSDVVGNWTFSDDAPAPTFTIVPAP